MSEEVAAPVVLPIEQRIAAVVVHDSIAKMQDEDQLDEGHCTVELKLHAELPEYTPQDFSPANDVEQFMLENKVATELKLTLPFSFVPPLMIKGLGANINTLERLFDAEVHAYFKSETHSIQVELISHKLQRSLYVTMQSHPNQS